MFRIKQPKVLPYKVPVQLHDERSYAIYYDTAVFQGNTMEALAIILETVIHLNSRTGIPPNGVSVKNIDGCLVFTWHPAPKIERSVYQIHQERFERLTKAAAAAIAKANTNNYLRYAEEVASELINQKYSVCNPFDSVTEMIRHFSYAPEIERFILLLDSAIRQAI